MKPALLLIALLLIDLPRVILWTGAGADLAYTEHRIHEGARELNPMGQHPAGRIALTFGTTALNDWAASTIKHAGHPRWAAALRIFGGSVHLGGIGYSATHR